MLFYVIFGSLVNVWTKEAPMRLHIVAPPLKCSNIDADSYCRLKGRSIFFILTIGQRVLYPTIL